MRTITIKGVGKVSVKPDLIIVSMRLDTEGKDYNKTMEQASEKIDVINQSLEKIGFEKKSVKTINFNVRTNYESIKTKDGTYKKVFCGYTCSHNLKVQFDLDTKRLANVLFAISQCNAKPEFSIAFTIKDPTLINKELLKSASTNAKEKAEILCSASNVKLGELINIDYNWKDINIYSNTDYRYECKGKFEANVCLSNIEIEPDDINLNDTATFVWEIH